MGREVDDRGFLAEIDRDKVRKTNGKMDGKDGSNDSGCLTLNSPPNIEW